VVDGRNIWKNSIDNTVTLLNEIVKVVAKEKIIVS